MNILLTGASSFTGFWFADRLVKAGHQVIAPLRGDAAGYDGVRRQRVERLALLADIVPQCPFGSDSFLQLMRSRPVDVLCHHAAMVTDYKSPDFDVVAALANNTRNLPVVLRTGRERGMRAVVLTSSVFEAGEGAGSAPLRAFSPYGVSKGLTSQMFQYWCGESGLPLAKFVIPNPFGPLEEQRFCAYLLRCWAQGKAASVATPAYIRYNIHVSLLAMAYADLMKRAATLPAFSRLGPRGYVETQGAFARRFASEIGRRLDIATPLDLADQSDFPEPAVRVNTDISDEAALGWREERAWDGLADYYRAAYFS